MNTKFNKSMGMLKEYASNENGKKSLIALGSELAFCIGSHVARKHGNKPLSYTLLGLGVASFCAVRHYNTKATEDFTDDLFNSFVPKMDFSFRTVTDPEEAEEISQGIKEATERAKA